MTNRYLESQGNWYYLGKDGYPLTGEQTINGQESTSIIKVFKSKVTLAERTIAIQIKLSITTSNSGARVRKEGLVQNKKGQTFYIKNDGSNLQEYVKLMVTSLFQST